MTNAIIVVDYEAQWPVAVATTRATSEAAGLAVTELDEIEAGNRP